MRFIEHFVATKTYLCFNAKHIYLLVRNGQYWPPGLQTGTKDVFYFTHFQKYLRQGGFFSSSQPTQILSSGATFGLVCLLFCDRGWHQAECIPSAAPYIALFAQAQSSSPSVCVPIVPTKNSQPLGVQEGFQGLFVLCLLGWIDQHFVALRYFYLFLFTALLVSWSNMLSNGLLDNKILLPF